MAPARVFLSTLLAIVALALSKDALAQSKAPVVVWPTLTPAGDAPDGAALHRPEPLADKDVFERAQELDATLRDAVQDLGFTLYVADAGPAAGHARDEDLLARAARSAVDGQDIGTWVVSPRLESSGGGSYVVRIVVALPNGRELRVRVETAPAESVGVRGLVMLRDLLSPSAAAQAATERDREQAEARESRPSTAPPHSGGRAVLAVNAALFGGFTSFSLQRSSGSTDPRVLYPLLALGAGVGVGSALLVADEWDITTGDAWYLSAGAWWGTAGGLFLADGANVSPLGNRYSWGVVGGLGGLTLATVALTRKHIDEGGAALTHSGAALGLVIGSFVEFSYKGSTTSSPFTGAGIGSLVGLVGAGTTALFTRLSASRVLLVDLGTGLGGLAGAATGSPLIFQTVTPARTQGFVAATLGGMLVGGATAWFLTRDTGKKVGGLPFDLSPIAGVIGQSEVKGGKVPAYGIGLMGRF